MARYSNNVEDIKSSSRFSSNSDANTNRSGSNWWLKNLQIENKNDNYIITNLMAELAILLNDKIRLEGENAVLQIENEDFQKKLDELNTNHAGERINLMNKINYLETCVRHFENDMKQISNDHFEETKNYLIDINTLKEQYESLKVSSEINAAEFKCMINNLERELEVANNETSELTEEINNNKVKLQKYKDKLKVSSTMICKLNNIVTKFTDKELSNKKTQTEDVSKMHIEPMQGPYEYEKIISELFFKEQPSDVIDPILLKSSLFERRY